MVILGIDTGGTFTDFVLYKDNTLTVHKVLSSPSSPEVSILKGMSDLHLSTDDLKIIHGSTVATNALLEGKGVKTAYIANKGLKDVLLIGRQARQSLYSLQPKPMFNPVLQDMCFEIETRLSSMGELITPVNKQELEKLVDKIVRAGAEAVAINLLFSFLDETTEKEIANAFPDEIFVSRSSDILPEYKEYERGMATWLNAYVGPLVQAYLSTLADEVKPAKVSIMMSSGGTTSAEQAGQRAVNLLLSGPAGGLQAAKSVGQSLHCDKMLTLDMGGTSTDVALIEGDIKLSGEAKINGLPVALPMVDMHTIGAGGGSIASIDVGGMLQVGPESAGANPGPACYGGGGKLATVTDANVVLGRLPAGVNLGGSLSIDVELAKSALSVLAKELSCSVYEAAEGVLAVANEHMVQALRLISVQKGIDPSSFSLMSFGGAGGLHVCDLAESMSMTQVIVPANAGVFSAFGMLVAPISRELSHAFFCVLTEVDEKALHTVFDELADKGIVELIDEGVVKENIDLRFSVDLRYVGQSFTINVDWIDKNQSLSDFHETHLKQYGHKLDEPVEITSIRVSLKAPTESLKINQVVENKGKPFDNAVSIYALGDVPLWARDSLEYGQNLVGPLLIVEDVTTILVKPGWQCHVTKDGHLSLKYTVVNHQ